jgi:gentisate 1,2-dioxygenase
VLLIGFASIIVSAGVANRGLPAAASGSRAAAPPQNRRFRSARMQATDSSIERQALYERMLPLGLTPLWEVLHALVPAQPAVQTRPVLWRWADVQPFLEASGRVISAEEAVRRVLILENPGWRGQSRATGTLYAGLQLILPGEVAPSHRHTQSALRFIVSGAGAYTAVDGERTTMHAGDFIITPAWTWHDHGNTGNESVVWLDGLDIPIVGFFEAGFAENDTRKSQPVARAEGASLARYGSAMLPLAGAPPYGRTSPVFAVPYRNSREALALLARSEAPDPWRGTALRYANPLSGGHAMPTIAAWLQLLPAGMTTKPWRSTAGAVYSVVEGAAQVTIARGDDVHGFDVAPRDHFVVPPWHTLEVGATGETVLFGYSDAPLQEGAGLLREERLPVR